ncbi:MAG: agmatine deiminase family protein [Acidimicrobiia bacterium]
MATPREAGFRMPPEWAPHARTWMAWPCAEYFADLDRARRAWAQVANTIARYEPVTVVANTEDSVAARDALDPDVAVLVAPIDDAWMRDSGPTFLLDADGVLGAVDWVFNGWGAQEWASWERDAAIAATVIERAGARRFSSELVNEGGGIHVDGEGTVILTETVQLDPDRNPDAAKASIEAELAATIGTTRAIWLPRGLAADYDEMGTRGHVDLLAAFVRPGVVVAHRQPDPTSPDHAVSEENAAILQAAGLEVIRLTAPPASASPGRPGDWSYVNFYVGNGFVLVGTFGVAAHDDAACETLATVFPGRTVEPVDARPMFECGGGIHCITQQQPASRT